MAPMGSWLRYLVGSFRGSFNVVFRGALVVTLYERFMVGMHWCEGDVGEMKGGYTPDAREVKGGMDYEYTRWQEGV